MELLKGIAASKGIAIGKIFFYDNSAPDVSMREAPSPQAELDRFKNAVELAKKGLRELHDRALETIGEKEALVFEIHGMMLEDLDYLEGIQNCITEKRCNAEYAVSVTGEQFAEMFASMDDDYMKERAPDVRDISNRVIRILTGKEQTGLDNVTGKVIIAAENLMPSETVALDQNKVLAFVTRLGSQISHSAILARTMGIPAVLGTKKDFLKLQDGMTAVVDGSEGIVIAGPDEQTLNDYEAKRGIFLEKQKLLRALIGKKAVSLDGKTIEINANIGHTEDASLALENDAEGIGLFRSEFLYMESDDFPSEEAQYKAYSAVLKKMDGKRVIVRTLDLGADKHAPYFKLPEEDNPALGYRAIRICLKQQDIFLTQIRALLRASVHGKLGVMFPMITSVGEVRQAKEVVEQAKKQLAEENLPFSTEIEFGIMVETPAAALATDLLAPEVDFFSIGTNDLTQYTLACDRMNNNLTELWDPRNVSVLRMIALTVKNAHRHGIWAGICGESAADPELAGLYLKFGVDELSVTPAAVLETRNHILHTDSTTVDDSLYQI